MEASEAQDLQEHHEHAAHDRTLHPISFTISVLAVLVAIVTVCGHRTHTEAVLAQTRASDQWNLYQAHKIRQYDTQLTADLFGSLPVSDPAAAGKLIAAYKAHLQKWSDEIVEDEKGAREQEAEVAVAERRADRFDLGEALLEIGLVVAAITLLTRQRSYWYIGMAFGAAGLLAAALGFTVH
jgi:hypothetical protein